MRSIEIPKSKGNPGHTLRLRYAPLSAKKSNKLLPSVDTW
jgi:hypothetical protein